MQQKLCPLSPLNENCNIRVRCEMPACWIKVISQIFPKISCHGNVSKGIKKRSGSRKFMQIPFIWWKDRENRSSIAWESFAQSKKKKKLTQAKYIALLASLPSGLNYKADVLETATYENSYLHIGCLGREWHRQKLTNYLSSWTDINKNTNYKYFNYIKSLCFADGKQKSHTLKQQTRAESWQQVHW